MKSKKAQEGWTMVWIVLAIALALIVLTFIARAGWNIYNIKLSP